jgi:sporulation-control protein
MIQQLLASIGIGSARADTVLTSSRLVVGEPMHGEVQLFGGQVNQRVGQIYVDLMYLREYDDKYHWASFQQWAVSDELELKAGERVSIPFTIHLPQHAPISIEPESPHPWKISRHQLKLRTGLSISWAIDPQDSDHLVIAPNAQQHLLFQALKTLGFSHRATSNSSYHKRLGYGAPIWNTLEFAPVTGEFKGRIDELEVTFQSTGRGLICSMQVDTRQKGLSGLMADALDTDERYVQFPMPQHQNEVAQLASSIRELVQRNMVR